MNANGKALAACRDLYRVHQEINATTTEIGNALDSCPNRIAFNRISYSMNAFEDACEKAAQEDVHLALAYRKYAGDAFYNPRNLSDSEITYHLSEDGDLECPHCLKAHNLVLHRKELKKQRGKIRRAITMIGKSAFYREKI